MVDWKSVELDKKSIVQQLKQQEEQINAILARREELKAITKENGCYDEIWEMLHADGGSHWSF